MNFGYSSLKKQRINPKHTENYISHYGVPDVMSNGLSVPIRDSLEISHPLEHIEKNKHQSEFQLHMNMLRNIQGIHAPLRIAMELKAFNNVGRLPFLSSSNLSKDVLMGRDDYIDFDDILNPPEMHENLLRPHITMERKLDIL